MRWTAEGKCSNRPPADERLHTVNPRCGMPIRSYDVSGTASIGPAACPIRSLRLRKELWPYHKRGFHISASTTLRSLLHSARSDGTALVSQEPIENLVLFVVTVRVLGMLDNMSTTYLSNLPLAVKPESMRASQRRGDGGGLLNSLDRRTLPALRALFQTNTLATIAQPNTS